MGYIKEFQVRLSERNFPRFLELWEEYLTVDTTDAAELKEILNLIKHSDLKLPFGAIVEGLLPMWRTISDKEESYEVLRMIFDFETTNSEALKELATQVVTDRHGNHPYFKEGIRLVGLKGDNFQGALRKFDLLVHLAKGNFVYHTSGWGTGEILDLSFVREQLTIEFENVSGKKDFSFANAFKTLEPLSKDGFLARRFANPDLLEAQAREDSLPILKLLLKDLGPKSAQEIKDELVELVIPDKEWAKWWQASRARLKKDSMIAVPESTKDRFSLRTKEKSLQDEAEGVFSKKGDLNAFIPALYSFIRDYPQALKEEKIKSSIESILLEKMKEKGVLPEADLQLALFLEQYLDRQVPGHTVQEGVARVENLEKVLDAIEVLALKKRALQVVQQAKKNWDDIFLSLLLKSQPGMIRDYLLKSLLSEEPGKTKFIQALEKVLKKPDQAPDFFVWYFQKVVQGDEIPHGGREGGYKVLETLLLLLSSIENQPQHKELARKIFNILSGKRYEVVRQVIQDAPTEFLKEFILLASKCNSFSEQDVKILRSLAAVVDPSLDQKKKKKERLDPLIFWTTEEALRKMQERIKHIATTETVDNSKEIEAARALGDLRENSEFKFAKERRARLQEEMGRLSRELQKARVITKEDVETDEIGIGNVITLVDSKGEESTYTILGPWDADADNGILSSQSPLAQAMMGRALGDAFSFKGEEYKVGHISTIFDEAVK
jgi:transcription elongation factor GreA